MPGNGPPTQGQLEEELAQIRRYEDFSTIGRYLCADEPPGDLLPRLTVVIDWVKDAILERYRQSSFQKRNQNDNSWQAWWRMTFETTQTWIVVSLVGKENDADTYIYQGHRQHDSLSFFRCCCRIEFCSDCNRNRLVI